MTIKVKIKHDTPGYDNSILVTETLAGESGIGSTTMRLIAPGDSYECYIWDSKSLTITECPNE